MVRFTSVVRRGLRQMLDRNLAAGVEATIIHNTRLGMKRGERFTAQDIAELRAAVAWIEQEAAAPEADAPQEVFDGLAAAIGYRAANDPKAVRA